MGLSTWGWEYWNSALLPPYSTKYASAEMRLNNLWDILECCKKILPLHHLRNKRICVDLSCWMVQLHSVKDKLYLEGLFHCLLALIALNCSPIFVTDGSIPAIKESANRCCLNAGIEAIQDDKNLDKSSSSERNMGSEFSCMIKEAKTLGMALGVQCLDGIEEAEAQCALLNSESMCVRETPRTSFAIFDGCFTSDFDAFLFGARTVYRDFSLGEDGYIICYEMDDIERELGFGRDSLIALSVLFGSDYNQGIREFDLESACQIVRSMYGYSVLQRIAAEGFSCTKKSQNLIRSKSDLAMGNQYLQVINAYMKPKCHSADSDVVYRVLAVHPVNRIQLHQVCAQYFDWPPTKTDEYVLPATAERNLRRFGKLRSTSSGLGARLPITEMAVSCPVSSIVRQRKIQGRKYFDVSWADVEGLEASVVPADLVESACPEKIVEFQQACKCKSRWNKEEDTTAEEIERKLRLLSNDAVDTGGGSPGSC